MGIVKSLTGQSSITEGGRQNSDGHVIEGDRQTVKVSAVSLSVVTPPRRNNDVPLLLWVVAQRLKGQYCVAVGNHITSEVTAIVAVGNHPASEGHCNCYCA